MEVAHGRTLWMQSVYIVVRFKNHIERQAEAGESSLYPLVCDVTESY